MFLHVSLGAGLGGQTGGAVLRLLHPQLVDHTPRLQGNRQLLQLLLTRNLNGTGDKIDLETKTFSTPKLKKLQCPKGRIKQLYTIRCHSHTEFHSNPMDSSGEIVSTLVVHTSVCVTTFTMRVHLECIDLAPSSGELRAFKVCYCEWGTNQTFSTPQPKELQCLSTSPPAPLYACGRGVPGTPQWPGHLGSGAGQQSRRDRPGPPAPPPATLPHEAGPLAVLCTAPAGHRRHLLLLLAWLPWRAVV